MSRASRQPVRRHRDGSRCEAGTSSLPKGFASCCEVFAGHVDTCIPAEDLVDTGPWSEYTDPDAPGQSVLEDGVRVPAGTSQRLACDGGRSTTAIAAAASRVAGFGSARAITSVTGRKAAPPRCRISPCSVAGTTARSMKRATSSIDRRTASFGSAARTADCYPRSRHLPRCPAMPCRFSERGTMRRGYACTRTPRPRAGWGSPWT